MKNPVVRLAVVGFAIMLAACASPAKLARQSSQSLAKGDLRKAYSLSLRAIEKDPQNQQARAAYQAASARVALDYQARVVATATADTVTAAVVALDYRQFKLQVARHQTAIAPALEYDRMETQILNGAARVHYQRGLAAMAERRPKIAVDEFLEARRYNDGYADVVARLEVARREATSRVALLPFADGIGVPGLSQEIGDTAQRQISQRASNELRFTQVVNAGDIERNMTVAEARGMRAEDAIALGKRVGADWVVVGRFHSIRERETSRTARIQLYHRMERRDSSGTVVTWDEFSIPVLNRQREVTVQYALDVVEVSTGNVLAHRDQTVNATARVVWTNFVAEANYDRYALLPPDIRNSNSRRASEADAAWRSEMGSWTVRDFMRSSRDERARSRYARNYRGDFYNDTRTTPAWLGELPSRNEMTFVALRDVWRDIMASLKELDAN
ncbi:MAG TPA: hypothetical protein VJR92_09840 [Gemmatimonadaceae bacterium]|nr:hypothetical protein [Gemmatimonadaceae bacterium]